MPPRKSALKASRSSQAATLPEKTVASSSKTTLDDIPPPSIPESVTPGYEWEERPRQPLSEEDRMQLIHELVSFHPRTILDQITEAARDVIYPIVGGIEGWGEHQAEGMGEDVDRELAIGLHALETLFETHVDKAFDRFTAWCLRNAFDVPADLDVVLPWHAGLDFQRGEHVAALPKGEAGVVESLDQLRGRVEQMRLLSQRLEGAEKILDRRLEIAKQRKAEIGFVQEVLASSGLSPLSPKVSTILSSLQSLHTTLQPLEIQHPTLAPPALNGNGKAWELGRSAYLNWAVGKMVGGAAGDGEGRLEGVEKELGSVGDVEGVERLGKAVGA
ncbi:hypothetical protein BCR39DRAFT_208631 [Naematelia encephala]|uniref:Mis12 protein-domain-containing protein n=1 Tax=Naematelia encephala TaxID=71784 RepID=A0A1Y2B074_9TREE|nr:hypothetical protein BCR39DRAFT_208631 [Naematelia encephala]